MGAWGSGSFENDTALDWAAEVESIEDVRRPFQELKAATGGGERGEPVDADLACELVAAAETVAMLMGRVSPDFPEDLRERLKDAGAPDELLFHQARDAICHVMRNSELADCGPRRPTRPRPTNGMPRSPASSTGSTRRSNSPPGNPPRSRRRPGGRPPIARFATGRSPSSEHFAMSIYDFSDAMSGAQTLSFHLPCLNARLHHRHAILDFKFDPDKPPNLNGL